MLDFELLKEFIKVLESKYIYKSTMDSVYKLILKQIVDYRFKFYNQLILKDEKELIYTISEEVVPIFKGIVIPEAIAVVTFNINELLNNEHYQEVLVQYYNFQGCISETNLMTILKSLDAGGNYRFCNNEKLIIVYRIPDYLTTDLIKQSKYQVLLYNPINIIEKKFILSTCSISRLVGQVLNNEVINMP